MEDELVLYAPFRTPSGFYIYDTHSNHILRTSEELWHCLSVPCIPARGRVATDNEHGAASSSVDATSELRGAIRAGYLHPCRVERMEFCPADQDLLKRIRTHVPQLTLELTERCNNRCAYCGYTYTPHRVHTPAHMNWQTATNALQLFWRHSRDATTRAISFWGGEPLLRFGAVRRIADYVDRVYPDLKPDYSLTTNGTLITEQVALFLIRSRCNVMVSLDGPAHVHDRYRIDHAGAGTRERVEHALQQIMRLDVDYYTRHVSFNCVLTPGTDTEGVFEFFATDPLVRDHRVVFTLVSPSGTPFLDEYGPYSKTQRSYLAGANWVEPNDRGGLLLRRYGRQRLLQLALRKKEPLGQTVPLNGSCVPLLRKMVVTVHGTIHLCESTPYLNAVGDVNGGGIDEDAILRLVKGYSENNLPHCRKCWALRLCAACYRDFMRDCTWSAPDRDEGCRRRRSAILGSLAEYARVLETDPGAFDEYKGAVVSVPR